jgi:hypothetical protein
LDRFYSFKILTYASGSKYFTGKQPYMGTSATQREHNGILSSPVQNHEINPTLNDNEACLLAIIMNLPNVDSHISILLLFILVPGQGTVCVPLEHGYGAWKNKDKVQNNYQKYYIGVYHEDNNTIDKSRL